MSMTETSPLPLFGMYANGPLALAGAELMTTVRMQKARGKRSLMGVFLRWRVSYRSARR
jgi:hypothetical protein